MIQKYLYGMNQFQIIATGLVIFLSFTGCSQETHSSAPARPHNVILIVGDGMGMSQITASFYLNPRPSVFSRFKHIGIISTHASNRLITDSAAGATAFATGSKTFNQAISVDDDHQDLETLFEEAEERAYKTGLAVTSQITHATPACFYAHDTLRKNYENIAIDFARSGTDVAVGFGQPHFDPAQRSDSADIFAMAEQNGIEFFSAIEEVPAEAPARFVVMPAGEPRMRPNRPQDFLRRGSILALDHLNSDPNTPFLMLIEGSQIDWGGHAEDASYIVDEMRDFEGMLQAVLDWAESDGETLVIVTADHETGGFSINNGPVPEGDSAVDSLQTSFAHSYHTGTLIPVFASGPGAENFTGLYDNTDIYFKIREALGWPSPESKEENDDNESGTSEQEH